MSKLIDNFINESISNTDYKRMKRMLKEISIEDLLEKGAEE